MLLSAFGYKWCGRRKGVYSKWISES